MPKFDYDRVHGAAGAAGASSSKKEDTSKRQSSGGLFKAAQSKKYNRNESTNNFQNEVVEGPKIDVKYYKSIPDLKPYASDSADPSVVLKLSPKKVAASLSPGMQGFVLAIAKEIELNQSAKAKAAAGAGQEYNTVIKQMNDSEAGAGEENDAIKEDQTVAMAPSF